MNQEGCGLAGSFVHALDPEGLVKSLGERVEVAIPPRAQAAGVFWLLGLPLALFGVGYAAGARYFAAGGEGPAALLGIGGFALGMEPPPCCKRAGEPLPCRASSRYSTRRYLPGLPVPIAPPRTTPLRYSKTWAATVSAASLPKRALMIAWENSPAQPGPRAVMRFPSVTTRSSTNFPSGASFSIPG